MTPPKPPSFKAKTGRKTKRERIQQDGRLMTNAILGDSPWEASLYAGCGYEYAVKKFLEFGFIFDHKTRLWVKIKRF